MKYRLGTRKSELAMKQASQVQQLLKQRGCDVDLVLIESDGDQTLQVPLYEIKSDSPGLFTKRLEKALLEDRIDLAVHSLKDLPTTQPNGLSVAAVTAREVAHDVLIVSKKASDPAETFGLKKGAQVGTSSLRRQAQITAVRPDLDLVSLRGNVPRRLNAVRSQQVDAVVLAAAGLERLAVELKEFETYQLPLDRFVPAPGQGALAIEVTDRCPPGLLQAIRTLNHEETAFATRVERLILKELEGGCSLPLGVHCVRDGKEWKVLSFLGIRSEGAENPLWIDFQSFDILGSVEHTLVSRTVQYFRSQADAAK